MSRTAFTSWIATAGLLATIAATPAAARDDDKPASAKKATPAERARDKAEARTEDRRDLGDTLGDAWLVTKVKAQFWDEDALDDSDVNVDAREGVIILRGTVASQAGKARAIEIARTTEGVKRVDDRLTVAMASRDRDDDEDALEDSDIDVDTNNGVVTLTGTVASQAGRARAVAIAKKIEGVKTVND